jgi:RimJ/RimL family protein N-acetyltransferase
MMFTRTARLLLRPGWAEDASALVAALGSERIVRNLAKAPWPYRRADAEGYLAGEHDPLLPSLLIFQRTDRAPVLVGGCGLGRLPSGGVQLGYWIAVPFWGRGYATEAGGALVDIARALRVPRLQASFFLDNPASGRVLEKLGFEPTGVTAPLLSRGRGCEAPAKILALQLGAHADAEESMAA